MKLVERPLILAAVLLAGCGTTRDVAVSSYHVTRDVAVGSYRVATAPVHYALRRRSNEPTMVGSNGCSRIRCHCAGSSGLNDADCHAAAAPAKIPCRPDSKPAQKSSAG